jgi:MFS family permease
VRAEGFQRPRPVLFSRLVIPQSTLMFILGTILCAPVVYMALFCKELGLPYAGHFFVICTIGVFISRLSAGRIHDRIGHPYVIVPSSLLLASTMLMLYVADGRNMIFAASLLYGFGIGAIFPSLQALALSSAPLDRRTEASASFFNAYDFGFGLGSLALGFIAGLSGSYATLYWVAALLTALFLGFYSTYYLVLHRSAGRPPRRADKQPAQP